MMLRILPTDALIVVDVQNDFLPGGALGVKDGDQIIPVVNKLLINFDHRVFTRDWHPENHISFADAPTFTDGSWPKHCVQGTEGAAFHHDLNQAQADLIINKADAADQEAYSGFQNPSLKPWLSERNIKRLFITGLATDYCVKNTALDALAAQFEVWVISDGIKGVDVPPGSANLAIDTMKAKGIHFIASDQLVRP